MPLSINLRIAGRSVVVIGGGRVAARRAATLLKAGAYVRAVARQFCAEMIAAQNDRLEVIERPYEPSDLAGAFIAIAATDDPEINAAVCADAAVARILCNNVSQPEGGDFTFPAVAQRGRVTIAVDSAGASPAFSARLLNELMATVDPRAADAAETLALIRERGSTIEDPLERRRLLSAAAQLPLDTLASMKPEEAFATPRPIESSAAQSVTCASRGSRLALEQTSSITTKLERAGVRSRVLTVATRGDLSPHRPLSAMNAENIFVKEIETALLDGRADYAVHSCKDLPSSLDAGLELVAISPREDSRDAFCSERFASFFDLPPGASVGTSSVRRRAQLMSLRRDLEYVNCRGNVDTRLRKLRDGEFDAIVIAMAGLQRLGAAAHYTIAFELDEMVPAVGQGALAIEMRAEKSELQRTIRKTINDPKVEFAIACERAALAALGGGCNAPIGIHAHWNRSALLTFGIVCSEDGSRSVSGRVEDAPESVEEAAVLGRLLTSRLAAAGAGQLLGSEGGGLPLASRLILLPRTQDRDSRLAPALELAGAQVVQVRGGEEAARALAEQAVDMVVFASSGSVDTVGEMFRTWRVDATRPAIAAMGEKSADAATRRGVTPDVVAEEPTIESLVMAVRQYFTGLVRPQ